MQILKSSSSIFSNSRFLKFPLEPKSSVFLLHCSSSPPSTLVANPPLLHYLVENLDFTETQALPVANRYPKVKHFENIKLVADFFKGLGFSNPQIAYTAYQSPQILFANVETTLRPKIKFFQDLGISKSHLGKFLSLNPGLLVCSLDKKLIPCFQLVKRVLGEGDDKALIQVFIRSPGFIARDSKLKLSRNIEYLESCGIVGSQLSNLLKRQPRIFRKPESALRKHVSRLKGMGFSTDSRMLAYAINTIASVNEQTFKKKWELLKSFGFSEEDCLAMFRKAPMLFKCSEEKIRLGIEFFTKVAKVNKNALVSRPFFLMCSLEDRVIPRYRVVQVIKSKKLLKKDPSFLHLLEHTESEFLEFISRFTDHVEELLIAYKAHLLHSSSSSEDEEES